MVALIVLGKSVVAHAITLMATGETILDYGSTTWKGGLLGWVAWGH